MRARNAAAAAKRVMGLIGDCVGFKTAAADEMDGDGRVRHPEGGEGEREKAGKSIVSKESRRGDGDEVPGTPSPPVREQPLSSGTALRLNPSICVNFGLTARLGLACMPRLQLKLETWFRSLAHQQMRESDLISWCNFCISAPFQG